MIIQFPERKQVTQIKQIQDELRSLYDGMTRINRGYWKLMKQATDLQVEYQEVLQSYSGVVGIENVPKELLEFAWILIDPDTGEITYIKDDEE